MSRRQSERIQIDEFLHSLKLHCDTNGAFDRGVLLDISASGLSMLVNTDPKVKLGDVHVLSLSIPGQNLIELKAEVRNNYNGQVFGFRIIQCSTNEEGFRRLIHDALEARVKNNVFPPGRWALKDDHFKDAIEHPWYRLLFKLYAEIYYTTGEFYKKRNYMPALMPITAESVSSPMGLGSDSLPVQVMLFDKMTYLADSMQFQLEYLLRHETEGIFYIMPTFRGEDPDSRHLNQFFHSEAEIRGGLADVMKLIEEYLAELSENILSKNGKDIEPHTKKDISHIKYFLKCAGNIPKVSHEEAYKILGAKPEYYSVLPGDIKSISSAGERELIRHFNGCLWLMHPPHEAVPFYQAYTDDGKYARSADFLIGIGETVGCGERHIDGAGTLKALAAHGVPPEEYDWYIKMKELYPIRTAGFGLGVERFLLWLLKHNDIRDMALMPRIKGVISAP